MVGRHRVTSHPRAHHPRAPLDPLPLLSLPVVRGGDGWMDDYASSSQDLTRAPATASLLHRTLFWNTPLSLLRLVSETSKTHTGRAVKPLRQRFQMPQRRIVCRSSHSFQSRGCHRAP